MQQSTTNALLVFLVVLLLVEQRRTTSASTSLDKAECLFVGCSCANGQIICPSSASPSSSPLFMFPKRAFMSGVFTSGQKKPNSNSSSSSHTIKRNHTSSFSFNVSTFEFTHQPLLMVPDDRLSKLAIGTLNLSHNRIDKLSPFAFRDTLRVLHVDLSHNRLQHLHAHVFAPIQRHLRMLDLSANRLGHMDPLELGTALADCGELVELSLADNELSRVPAQLTRLVKLRRLSLASNRLHHLVAGEWPLPPPPPPSHQLTHIGSSSSSGVVPLLPGAQLVHLDLSHNLIEHLENKALGHMRSLHTLLLQHNPLSTIAHNAFAHATHSLATLDMSGARLRHIPERLLAELANLSDLNLSAQRRTPIGTIGREALSAVSPSHSLLERIDLSGNRIARIHPGAFCRARHFAELDLADNALVDTPFDICTLYPLRALFAARNSNNKALSAKTDRTKMSIRIRLAAAVAVHPSTSEQCTEDVVGGCELRLTLGANDETHLSVLGSQCALDSSSSVSHHHRLLFSNASAHHTQGDEAAETRCAAATLLLNLDEMCRASAEFVCDHDNNGQKADGENVDEEEEEEEHVDYGDGEQAEEEEEETKREVNAVVNSYPQHDTDKKEFLKILSTRNGAAIEYEEMPNNATYPYHTRVFIVHVNNNKPHHGDGAEDEGVDGNEEREEIAGGSAMAYLANRTKTTTTSATQIDSDVHESNMGSSAVVASPSIIKYCMSALCSAALSRLVLVLFAVH